MESTNSKQRRITESKVTDVCSVGSGKGYDGYRGQQRETAQRRILNAVEAKERCKAINERLTADKVNCKLDSKGESLILRFSAMLRDATDKPTHEGGGTKQWSVGCGLYSDDEGFHKAEFYARQISQQLRLKLFTWEWFDKEIKGLQPAIALPEKQPTIGEMVEKFKRHYLSERRKDKNPENNWESGFNKYFKKFDFNVTVSEIELVRMIQTVEPNTHSRNRAISAIRALLKHNKILREFEEVLEDFESSTEYEPGKLKILSDVEIENFVLSIKPRPSTNKIHYQTLAEWRWTFGLIATYGLRPHEALNVHNLYKPYEYMGKAIPALNDPTNTTNLIVVDGKTGMRVAMPLSPEGRDWVSLFELKNPMPRQLKRRNKLQIAGGFGMFLSRRGHDFKTYSLRHRFNHRCRERGIDTSTAALSMGHSEMMNSTTYKRQMGGQAVTSIIANALAKAESKVETAQTIETLRLENELLRTQNNLQAARIAELERRLSVLVEEPE